MAGIGGRPKGVKNKITKLAHEKAEELGIDPFKILLLFAKGDWKALGYKEETYVASVSEFGNTEKHHIEANTRAKCAADACRYLHPTQKAVEIIGDQVPFKVILEDYCK